MTYFVSSGWGGRKTPQLGQSINYVVDITRRSRASEPWRRATSSRHGRREHRTDVAPVVAAAAAAAAAGVPTPRGRRSAVGGRPEREVVGEGGQRAHVHEVVAQQAVATTQRPVDVWHEPVAAVDGKLQRLQHVVHPQPVRRRVVVAADTEYVSVENSPTKQGWMLFVSERQNGVVSAILIFSSLNSSTEQTANSLNKLSSVVIV